MREYQKPIVEENEFSMGDVSLGNLCSAGVSTGPGIFVPEDNQSSSSNGIFA